MSRAGLSRERQRLFDALEKISPLVPVVEPGTGSNLENGKAPEDARQAQRQKQKKVTAAATKTVEDEAGLLAKMPADVLKEIARV